jgi:hypothetical protein
MTDKLKKEYPSRNFTKEEIKLLLQGYEHTEFDELHKGYLIRYFTKENDKDELKFRSGGTIILIKKKDKLSLEEYVRISNNGVTWTVQKNNAIFYQQIPLNIIKEMLEEKYEGEITELKSYCKKLELTIRQLQKEINNLKK